MDMLIFIRLGYKDKLTNNLRQVGQQGQMWTKKDWYYRSQMKQALKEFCTNVACREIRKE